MLHMPCTKQHQYIVPIPIELVSMVYWNFAGWNTSLIEKQFGQKGFHQNNIHVKIFNRGFGDINFHWL